MVKSVVANVFTFEILSFLHACIPSHVAGTLITSLDESNPGSMILQSRSMPKKPGISQLSVDITCSCRLGVAGNRLR